MGRIVKKWLEGIGLPSAVIANFDSAGIVKPEDLLELEVCHYESLGIDDPNDRRKLFFLVQKLKQLEAAKGGGNDDVESGSSESGSGDRGSADGSEESSGGHEGHKEDDKNEDEDYEEDYHSDDDSDESSSSAASAADPPPPPSSLDDERPIPRSRRSTRTAARSVLETAADTTSTSATATAKPSRSSRPAVAEKKEKETRRKERTKQQDESDSSPVSAASAATSSSAPSVDENQDDNNDDGDGVSKRTRGTKLGRAKSASASGSTSSSITAARSTRSASSRGSRSSTRAAASATTTARTTSKSPVRPRPTTATRSTRTTSKSPGRPRPTTATRSSRTASKSPVRPRPTTATRSSRTASKSPVRPIAANRSPRTTSKSPVRPTTATSRTRTTSKSPVRPTTATRSRRPVSASSSKSTSKSPIKRPVASKISIAGGRSPVRQTTRTKAAAASKSPIKRTASAAAAKSACSRSSGARSKLGAGPSKRDARSGRTTTTMQKATMTRSPTKPASTQTPEQQPRMKKALVDEDYASFDNSSARDELEGSLVSTSEKVVLPKNKRSTVASARGSSKASDNSASARPSTAKSRGRRSMMKKQTSLPSIRSKGSNSDDDEGSVSSILSKSSTGTNKSSSSGRRKSVGMPASASFDSDSDHSSRKKAAASSIGGGRSGKRQSKLQGPSKIPSRTGVKGLSTIPAERAAIMSPLVKIQLDDVDVGRKTISYDDDDDDEGDGRNKSKARFRRGGSLSSTGSDGRRRLSAPLARAKSSSDLSSDDDQSSKRTGKRRSKSGRQSLGSLARPRSRSSSIGMSERDKAASAFASSPPRRSRSPASRRSESVVSSDIDLSAELDTSVSTSGASAFPSGAVFVQGMPEDKSWGTQVSRLREENNATHELEVGHSGPHHDDEVDDEMRIRVVIRKRPMSKSEAAKKDDIDVIHPLDYDGYGKVNVYQPKTRVDLTKEVETIPFAFDNTFDEASNNVEIYERTVSGLVPDIFEGKFCNVFAYGQTGSGKTFTMMGSDMTGANAGNQDNTNPGLYYLAAQDVFYLANEEEFRHLSVTASLFEIYSGKLFDLVNGRSPIKCLEDHRGKVCFPGLTEHTVQSAAELMQVMEAGAANRSTGTTSKNTDSSRSHAVLQLSLKNNRGRKVGHEHGRLTFIDLAGSERGADTSQASRTTRLEGAEINTSLLALKEVIRALATGDSMKHIPFRGSKLTQVLKESFVGKNNRTVMVACVAPNMNNCDHTLNTLRYADRVKERDAETGNVAAAVAEASRIQVKKADFRSTSSKRQRPATAPIGASRSFDSGRSGSVIEQESEYSSRGSFQEFFEDDGGDDEDNLIDDDVESDNGTGRGTSAADSFEIERLLSDDVNEEDSGGSIPKPPTNKEAAQSLIETHREVMSEMLNMVKREMILVNGADADRDTIEAYLLELEDAQEKQLSMISSLRESLLEYYASRSTSKTNGLDNEYLDDDEEYDLRD